MGWPKFHHNSNLDLCGILGGKYWGINGGEQSLGGRWLSFGPWLSLGLVELDVGRALRWQSLMLAELDNGRA